MEQENVLRVLHYINIPSANLLFSNNLGDRHQSYILIAKVIKENEYKIIIKGITVKQELLENRKDKPTVITEALKEALVSNLQIISE